MLESTAWATLGRIAIGAGMVLLCAGAWTIRSELRAPPAPLVLLLGSVALLVVTATVSGATAGCLSCEGAWYGFLEFSAAVVAFAAAVALVPTAAAWFVVCAAAGSLLAAGLALAGIESVHDTLAPVESTRRIAGPIGNPNYLAFAVATGLPLLLTAARRGVGAKVVAGLAASVAVVTIVLTYSRAGVLAAGIGSVIGIALMFRSRQTSRRALLAGGIGLIVLGAVAFGAFESRRTEADFGGYREILAAQDLSGWDGTPQGPIPAGPAGLENSGPDVLVIAADQAGEGASIALPAVVPGERYTVRFFAATTAPYLPFSYALRDNFRASGLAIQMGGLSPRWRLFSLSWRPEESTPNPRFYIWQTGAPGRLFLMAPRVTDRSGAVAVLDTRLRGSVLSSNPGVLREAEQISYRSRAEVLEVALDAFLSSPITGIGWQRFPSYAADRVQLGAFATHNEYLRFAAELGMLGLLGLGGVGVALVVGFKRIGRDPRRAGPAGALAAGAVGLLFVNALVTPVATIPLMASMAVIVGSAQWRRKTSTPGSE